MRRSSLTCTVLLLFIIEGLAGPWIQKPSLPGPGRHRAFSFVVGNKAYIGGGWNGWTMFSDFWEFDPASNSWTQRANTPINCYTSSGAGIGNKGYVCGGTLGASLLEYDPSTNTWVGRTSAPQSFFWESSAVTINNKMYVSDWNSIYTYDPVPDAWQVLSPVNPQNVFGPAVEINNCFYSFFEGGSGTLKFDPQTNTFTQLATFPGEARGQASAFSAGGKAYAGVGDGFINDNINDFWEYDPMTNSWKRIDDLPGDTRENAVTFTLNGRGYLATGTNGINHQDFWMLVPENITGIHEFDPELFSIGPNPVVDVLNIRYSGKNSPEFSISLFSNDGKLITHDRFQDHWSFNRANLASGIYYYKVIAGTKSVSGKLVFR